MEEQKHQHKSSIFLCKKCKTEKVEIEKQPPQKRLEKKLDQILIKPAGVHQDSKYIAQVGNRNVQFGARSYSDMTQHGDEDRKQNYIARHSAREQQYYDPKNKDNYLTRAFWAYWLLWNKKSIVDSLEDLQKHLPDGIQLKYTKNSIEKQQKDLKKAITHDVADNDE